MRKRRRKIRRRKKPKNKKRKKRNWLWRHYNSPVTHRYTKITTETMLIIEGLFLLVCTVWALADMTGRITGLW